MNANFCNTTPILVNDSFLALGMTVNFPPWEQFFDFPFRSYSCFCKKIRLTHQKVFPPPTVGVPSASKDKEDQKCIFWTNLAVFGPRILIFMGVSKMPILINDPFLALGMTVNFHLGNNFSTFRSGVRAVSEKKISDGSKSLPPSHCGSSVCQ